MNYKYKINLPQGAYFTNDYQIKGSLIEFVPVAKESYEAQMRSYQGSPDYEYVVRPCSERLILASHFTIFELAEEK